MSEKVTAIKVNRTTFYDVQFYLGNEPRPFAFTSIVNGKLNGKFLPDGCYAEKGGLDIDTRCMLIDRIDRLRPELERLAKEML